MTNQKTIEWLARRGKPVAIIDIDGVMQDCNHRLHHIIETVNGYDVNKKDADWDTFHKLAHLDGEGAFVRVAHDLAKLYSILFLTARSDIPNARAQLTDVLEVIMPPGPLPKLIMREAGSYEHPVAFKQGIVRELKAAGVDIAMAVDDSQENCKMFAAEGITSLRLYNHLSPSSMNY